MGSVRDHSNSTVGKVLALHMADPDTIYGPLGSSRGVMLKQRGVMPEHFLTPFLFKNKKMGSIPSLSHLGMKMDQMHQSTPFLVAEPSCEMPAIADR